MSMNILDGLSSLDRETQKKVFDFFDTVDPSGMDVDMQETLLGLMLGAAATDKTFKAQAEKGTYKFENEQHPGGAVSTSMGQSGLEEWIVEPEVGGYLTLRLPGSIIFERNGPFDKEGTASNEFLNFDALLTLKKIPMLPHQINNKNEIFAFAYRYYAAGCHAGAPLPADLASADPILIEDAKNFVPVFSKVERQSDEYYAKVGVDLSAAENKEHRLNLGLGIEEALRNAALYKRMPSSEKRPMASLVLDEYSGKKYLLVPGQERFIEVPVLSGEPKSINQRMQFFLSQLPGYDSPVGGQDYEWQDYAQKIATAHTEYWHHRAELEKDEDAHKKIVTVFTCADSRTTSATTTGAPEAQTDVAFRTHRTAGVLIVLRDGTLSKSTRRAIAITKLRGGKAIIMNHGGCGAVEIADKHLSGELPGLDESFQKFGDSLTAVYADRMIEGKTPQETLDHYREQTGINFKTLSCYLSYAKSEKEADTLQKAMNGTRLIRAFHNTPEGKIYVQVQNADGSKKNVAVPVIDGLLEKLAPQRLPVRHEIRSNPTGPSPAH